MGRSILVVDDNDFNRDLVKDILEDEDVTVYEAPDGDSAVDFMKSADGEHVDVILMDLRMPVMDGLEAARLIRQAGRMKVVIIAMTADLFESDKKNIYDSGMNGIITKPIEVTTLADNIAKVAGW